jgi:hypothetical protein
VTDHATPNLPSRDLDATAAFYARLGFIPTFKNSQWMILKRGGITLEFFPYPDLKPEESWFSCCLRLDDVPSFYELCRAAGLEDKRQGYPRLHAPRQDGDLMIGALIDLDGTLVRLIQTC